MKQYFVFILSSALGDTLAWIPYVEEFRKKNNVRVVCCTYHNDLFVNSYPNIEFISPEETLKREVEIKLNYEVIDLAYFFDYKDGIAHVNYDIHTNDYKKQPLQKLASDLLKLDFREIKPKVDFIPGPNPISNKYVCIANYSTAQCKFWNNPIGWQQVVDYLKSLGYVVISTSREPNGYMGNFDPEGIIHLQNKTLHEIMNYIYHADFFIGLSSGLSWLAWALNKKIILISGFTKPYTEMNDCIRISVPNEDIICNGCNSDFLFDISNWNWCPRKKHFECTRTITGNVVIDKIKQLTNVPQDISL